MDTSIELQFADGSYLFALPVARAVELQRLCGTKEKTKSIFQMLDEMEAGLGIDGDIPVYVGGGSAMIEDIRHTIRMGLIGGNSGIVDNERREVGPQDAQLLIDAYVYPERPLTEGLHVAWAILNAAIRGVNVSGTAKKKEVSRATRSQKARSSSIAGS